MHQRLAIDFQSKRAILLQSPQYSLKRRLSPSVRTKRVESTFGTKSYSDALQRAFNNAKQQIFFNPDMNQLVTLTYKGLSHTPEQVLYDVKQFIKTEKRNNPTKLFKYIYIMEYQKRGSIHVHMITNNNFTYYTNKNGYRSLQYWKHGYSSILPIKKLDGNFKPYLYLFKYMKKAQRIGKSFVHSSRNLNNYQIFKSFDASVLAQDWNTFHQEVSQSTIPILNKTIYYHKKYLCYDKNINNNHQEIYDE